MQEVMKTGRGLGFFLLGLALSAVRAGASEIEIRFEVMLRTGSDVSGSQFEPVRVSLDEAGARELRRLAGPLIRHEAFEDSHLARIHRILGEEAVQAGIRRAVRPSGGSRIRFLFNPTDDEESLQSGELLAAWDPETNTIGEVRVQDGDNLWAIATRQFEEGVRTGWIPEGLDLEDRLEAIGRLEAGLRRANRLRFDAWPSVGDPPMDLARERVVMLGEHGAGGVPEDTLRAALVHEAGHIGDLSTCRDSGDGYGLLPGHSLQEIVTPHAAFLEGWAQYQSLEFRSDRGRSLVEGIRTRDLYYESSQHRVQRIPAQHLEIWDLVSNEAYVARLLKVLADEVTRDPVEEVFQRTFGKDCGDLVAFLREFTLRYPEIQLEPVLARAFDLRDQDAYGTLLTGELPSWYSSVAVLRRRSFELVRGPPALALPEPSELDGSLLGQ